MLDWICESAPVTILCAARSGPLCERHCRLRDFLLKIETDAKIFHERPMLRRGDIPQFEASAGTAIILAIGLPERHLRSGPIHWCSHSSNLSLYLSPNFTSPDFPETEARPKPAFQKLPEP